MNTDLKKACAKEIKQLLPNISGADKLEACVTCKISRPTLDKMLKGNISNIDKALDVIKFFRGKVEERYTLLQGAA